jgi:acyl homoserine lactone synthase
MMSEVFGSHFEPDATLCSPRIWEVTRFCVRDDLKMTATPSGLNLATIELFAGVCELGRATGISHVTGVYEPMMGRIYRRAGMRTSVIGQSTTLGLPKVYAGLWELTLPMLRSLRAAGGFDNSVLAATDHATLVEAVA